MRYLAIVAIVAVAICIRIASTVHDRFTVEWISQFAFAVLLLVVMSRPFSRKEKGN